MNKARWIGAGLTVLAVLAALGAGLYFGGGPTTRNGWEAASWAAAVTATLALAVNAVLWGATRQPSTPDPEPAAKPLPTGNPAQESPRVPAKDQEPIPPSTYNGPHIEIHDNQVNTIIGQQNNHPDQSSGKNPRE